MSQEQSHFGHDVFPYLACIYPQLYVKPDENGLDLYKKIVLSGQDAPSHDLSHFIMHDEDSAVYEETPAGTVLAVTLHERQDFETFLQIITNKCRPMEIPASQGASMLEGLVNWTKIKDHEAAFFAQAKAAGITDPDWESEFARFTSDKKNYTDALVVLSAGPYSAVSGERFGISKEQWISDSVAIRKYHELNHFICRRLWPEKISAVWDECVADAVGIYAAYGRYDLKMAEVFLGIQDSAYIGGRLENYVQETDPDLKQKQLDCLSAAIHPILLQFDDIIRRNAGIPVFDMVRVLEDLYKGEITA